MALYKSLNPKVKIFKIFYERANKAKTIIFNETCFWDIISYNLRRRLETINTFITRKYSKKAGYKTGPYTKQEYALLKQLVNKHGHNVDLISSLLNRTAESTSTRYNKYIKNKINVGAWREEEKKRFFCIVKRLMNYNQKEGSPIFKISWRAVSDFVLTRSFGSCAMFAKNNQPLLDTLLVHNNFTLLMKEAIILYIYFTKNKSETDIKWEEELFILLNGKFTEDELKKEYHNIMTILPICDKIKTEYKSLFQNAEHLLSRIKFENVLLTMTKPRTMGYLKAKYYLLVYENVPKSFKKNTSEKLIMMLHNKYVSKLIQNETTDLVEQPITRNMIVPSIDLTLISDDDDLATNDNSVCMQS